MKGAEMKKTKRPNKTKTDLPEIIPVQEFKDSLKALGFTGEEIERSAQSALNLGLMSLVVGRGGVPCYRVATPDEAAKIAGCDQPGDPVEVPLDEFISDWKQELRGGGA